MTTKMGQCRKFGWAVVTATLVLAANASAQSHGVRIGKGCESPVCRGEATDCTIEVGHNDGFGDTIAILEAWDVVDPDGLAVRVPAAGNLPIVNVEGNTTCTVGGSLPCLVCAAGVSCGGNPPVAEPGTVLFASNTYVSQPGDPDPLEDQANIRVQDQCDSPTTQGCSMIINRIQFTAASDLTDCDDGNPCTTDTCAEGVCTFIPDCDSDDDCDDLDVCTRDICTVDGCCENTPLCTVDDDCDDLDACTTDTCVGGCCVNTPLCTVDDDCDDLDACTTDACVGGCCVSTPLCTVNADCDDQNACTSDTCEAGCCVNTPECTVDADCNDQNACTRDVCDGGCCVHVPDCKVDGNCNDDGNLCTIESCDVETSCCERTDVVCDDDGDPCTEEICNPSTGDCDSTPIDPPPPGCEEDFAGCTPGFWKQPHHFQYWPAPYTTGSLVNTVFGVNATGNPTLLKALSTGGGGEIAFLRHAVAALLNSARDDVNYFYSTAQVISMVQEAYATGNFQHFHGLFAEQNELGCTVVKVNTPRGGDRGGAKGGR